MQARLLNSQTQTLIIIFLISWVANYTSNAGFLTSLMYQDISHQTLQGEFCNFTREI